MNILRKILRNQLRKSGAFKTCPNCHTRQHFGYKQGVKVCEKCGKLFTGV